MLKKLLLAVSVAAVLLFSVFTPSAKAQTWYNQTFPEWWTKVNDADNPSEIFGERYTAAQVQWVIYGLFSFVLNSTTGDPETTSCLMNNDVGDCIDRLRNFFDVSSNPITSRFQLDQNESFSAFMLKDRPLSGITYVKNVLRKYSVIPEAKAQTSGFGFNALDPILPIWKASRNVAYVIFVLAVLALAFMIMFRVKISPQVVITAQSALPKIVIAVILVTFSYAIAGFLIDLMYVFIGIISLFMTQVYAGLGAEVVPTVSTIFNFLTKGVLQTGIMGLLALYWVLAGLIGVFTFLGANGVAGAVLGMAFFSPAIILITTIVMIILAILLMYIGIKIIFMLFKAFATLILLVLVAPLQISLGVVVSSLGFGAWLRSFISNLMVFPITGLFISLAYLFLAMATISTFDTLSGPIGDFFVGLGLSVPGVNWITAAFVNQGWPPLLVFPVLNSYGILYLGVSVIIVFILPKTADIIKSMIEGKPFVFGAAIGEAVAPARLPAAAAVSYGTQRAVGAAGEKSWLGKFVANAGEVAQKRILGGK